VGTRQALRLFAGQQYMDISGLEAEAIWAALCRLSTEARGFGVGSGVASGSTGEQHDERDP
jgi:hypothetical protein